MKYGRSEDEWVELAAASRDFLIECAAEQRLTSYSELNVALVERTDHEPFDFSQASDRHAMGHLLFRVVDLTKADEFMLSAVVVYVDGNDAGPGFYALAADLGLLARDASTAEREVFWTQQVAAIFNRYKGVLES